MLSSYREGLLKFDKEPYLIIREIVTDNGNRYIAAYGVATDVYKKSEGEVVRKAYTMVQKPALFTGGSVMSRKAQQIFARKEEERAVERPPKFIAPVIVGTDTFTGKVGYGFYEHTDDREVAGEFIQGKPTGVFISLDLVKFGDTKIDEGSLIAAAKEAVTGRSEGFYEL